MSNTSSSVPPYLSAQSWTSFGASTSRAVMRRLFAARLTEIAQATGGFAHETTFDEEPDFPRDVGRQRLPIDSAAQHGSERVCDRAAGKGATAGQHLEQNGAERPDVGARIDRRSDRLL